MPRPRPRPRPRPVGGVRNNRRNNRTKDKLNSGSLEASRDGENFIIKDPKTGQSTKVSGKSGQAQGISEFITKRDKEAKAKADAQARKDALFNKQNDLLNSQIALQRDSLKAAKEERQARLDQLQKERDVFDKKVAGDKARAAASKKEREDRIKKKGRRALALVETGSKGVLGKVSTGRRKVLGN